MSASSDARAILMGCWLPSWTAMPADALQCSLPSPQLGGSPDLHSLGSSIMLALALCTQLCQSQPALAIIQVQFTHSSSRQSDQILQHDKRGLGTGTLSWHVALGALGRSLRAQHCCLR